MKGKIYFHRKRDSLSEGVPVFSMMRNEKYFLPHFLHHYRRLGVRSFVVYADRCDDEFMAMLEAEKDISILISKELKYGDMFGNQLSGVPRRLVQFLKEEYSNKVSFGKWHCIFDSDEFLILPPPFTQLDDFVRHLEGLEMNYSFATMLDFFPRTLARRNFDPETDPFRGSPHFDKGPYHSIDPSSRKLLVHSEGVRSRIFRYLRARYPDEVRNAGIGAYPGALNFKFPILKTSDNLLRDGCHRITKLGSLASRCAIAHFKFYPELDSKLSIALKEGQYYSASVEYRFLGLALKLMGNVDLAFAGSMKYTSPEDVVKAQVIESLQQKVAS